MQKRQFLKAVAATAAAFQFPTTASAQAQVFTSRMQKKQVRGHNMAYIDEGAGDPVVFFHGNPTSSYLWRNIMPYVAEGRRVIAADMIGMGDSDKPNDLAYSYNDHAAHLHGLLDALDLQNATLVLHDWGGALGFDWASRNPDRVKAVSFMETVTPPAMPVDTYEDMGPAGDLMKAMRTDGVGEKMVLEDNFFIEEILGKIAVNTPLQPDVLDQYNRYYPDAESRKSILAWPRELPIEGAPHETVKLMERLVSYMTTSEVPKLAFAVTPGGLASPPVVKWWQENMSNLQVIDLGSGSHFIQEDYPKEIGTALASWLQQV